MIPKQWVRLWAVAVIAHIIGNPRFGQLVGDTTSLGVATAGLLALAVALLLRPSDRPIRLATNVGVVLVAWLEAPVIGNHWLLAALIAIAMLAAETRKEPWNWFLPTARWMFLGFYAWAAFAKLNSAFFDPSVSCGLVYANQWLDGYGLAQIPETSMAAWGPILTSAFIELSIPVLLILRRARLWGVALGVAFHGLISLDLHQHFYDFTAVLLALFALYVPAWTDGRIEIRRTHLMRPFVVVAGLIGLAGLFPATEVTVGLVRVSTFVVWMPFLVWFCVATWREVRGEQAKPDEVVPGVLHGPAAWLLVGAVFLNGLLPYLEVKTATSWNMYANLVTANGESNHLVIRSTLPLTDHQRRLATVLETDDPGLQLYVGSGYGIVERHFLDYLVDHPHAKVRYEVDGVEVSATGGEISEPLGFWTGKFGAFRSVDLESPAQCQLAFLPAR